MVRQEYFVIKDENQWRVRHNGQLSAALPTQGQAIMEAVERAHRDGKAGYEAQG